MDQHKIKHSKRIGREIASGWIPFSIDVKRGEKEKEHEDLGEHENMMIGGTWVLPSMTEGEIFEWDFHWCQRSRKECERSTKECQRSIKEKQIIINWRRIQAILDMKDWSHIWKSASPDLKDCKSVLTKGEFKKSLIWKIEPLYERVQAPIWKIASCPWRNIMKNPRKYWFLYTSMGWP